MLEKPRGDFDYKLKIPNREVEISLNDLFINYLTDQAVEKTVIQNNLYLSLQKADLKEFKKILKSLFTAIPYNNYVNNNILSYEGYYASVIYAYLSSEFKVLKSSPKNNTALNQIIKNNYHEKYMAKYNEIYLLGIVFNENKRNIVKFNHKKIKK